MKRWPAGGRPLHPTPTAGPASALPLRGLDSNPASLNESSPRSHQINRNRSVAKGVVASGTSFQVLDHGIFLFEIHSIEQRHSAAIIWPFAIVRAGEFSGGVS